MARPWQLWLLIALAAGILEVTVPLFTYAFVSIAALVAMLMSLQMNFIAQILAFTITLVVTLLFVRPRLLIRFHRDTKMPSRSQELVGSQGEVTEAIDSVASIGRVMVRGQDWAAKSQNALPVGSRVTVSGHDGIVLIVKEI